MFLKKLRLQFEEMLPEDFEVIEGVWSCGVDDCVSVVDSANLVSI